MYSMLALPIILVHNVFCTGEETIFKLMPLLLDLLLYQVIIDITDWCTTRQRGAQIQQFCGFVSHEPSILFHVLSWGFHVEPGRYQPSVIPIKACLNFREAWLNFWTSTNIHLPLSLCLYGSLTTHWSTHSQYCLTTEFTSVNMYGTYKQALRTTLVGLHHFVLAEMYRYTIAWFCQQEKFGNREHVLCYYISPQIMHVQNFWCGQCAAIT